MQTCPTSPLSVDGLHVNVARLNQNEQNNSARHQLSKVSKYADFTEGIALDRKHLRVKLALAHHTPPMDMKQENFVEIVNANYQNYSY